MPDHTSIKETLADIFGSYKDFFSQLSKDKDLDRYKNAFIDLEGEHYDIKHFSKCFSALRKGCDAALAVVEDRKLGRTTEVRGSRMFNTNEAINHISKECGTGKRRETFKDWVEAVGIERGQNIFSSEEIERIIRHVNKNYNKRTSKKYR